MVFSIEMLYKAGRNVALITGHQTGAVARRHIVTCPSYAVLVSPIYKCKYYQCQPDTCMPAFPRNVAAN